MAIRSRFDFDVVVAGGGGAGCLAASRLARQGARVALVERGGPPSGASCTPSDLRRGRAIRLLQGADPEWAYEGSSASDASYSWVRAIGLGGRLNYWLGTSLRLERRDFADTRRPDLGWPIDYDDLSPYYDEIEEQLGCAPGVDAGFPYDRLDEWIATAAEACGVRAVPARQARTHQEADRGGVFGSFSPLDRWLPEAHKTGRCVILPSMAITRVLTSNDGKVGGVQVVTGGRTATVDAPVVLLATSTIETARLLLDSRTTEHPTGLGNESGLVGKRLMDHVVVWARALVRAPAAAERRWHGQNRSRPLQTCYIPEWRDDDAPPPSRFHIQVMVRDVTDVVGPPARSGQRTMALVLAGVGEALAAPGNEVVVDPAGPRDTNGSAIPLVRFRWDESHRLFALRIRAALLELLGALPCGVDAVEASDGARLGGHGHEVGTARMAASPSDGVASPRSEVHGVDNLFLVDGSPFASCPHQNPTLTILANCARVCDEAVSRM